MFALKLSSPRSLETLLFFLIVTMFNVAHQTRRIGQSSFGRTILDDVPVAVSERETEARSAGESEKQPEPVRFHPIRYFARNIPPCCFWNELGSDAALDANNQKKNRSFSPIQWTRI